MLRPQLEEALKRAMKAREQCRVATIRLILAALKDRDIAERGKGNGELDDNQILALLQTMIRQRRESIEQYERGGRIDLAEREAEEIAVIQTFLPPAIEGDDLVSAVRGVVNDLAIPGGTLHAGQELEFKAYVTVGDSLTCKATLLQNSVRGEWRFMVVQLGVENGEGREVMAGKSTIMLPV